ncbi:MAG: TonB-dependent receptor [Gammaproteobacteria bacterium]|nr:TonB-dependent receptor [Gammaproteobacteria bacterium]
MKFRYKSGHPWTIASLLSVAVFQQSQAADTPNTAGTSGALEEVTVTAHYQFLSADTSGTTNLPLPVEQVPQTINIVSNDFIYAADLKTLGEIGEYTPGATNAGYGLNFGTSINLRGYPAAKEVDGLTDNDTNFEADYAIYDRLEVVQGPSSVVYGASSPGGLVNFVTKSATADTPSYLLVSGGSWDRIRVEAQGATALDSSGSLRGIGIFVRDQGGSFIQYMSDQKTSVYGGLNFKPNDKLSAYVHGGYERFVRNSIGGTLPSQPDGTPALIPRSFLNGAPDMKLYTDLYFAESDLTWSPTAALQIGLKARFEHSNTPGFTPYTVGLQFNGDVGLQVQQLFETLAQDIGLGLSGIYHLDGVGLTDSFVSLGVVRQVNQQELNWVISPICNFNLYDNSEQALFAAYSDCLTQGNATGNSTPYDERLHFAITTASLQAVITPVKSLTLLLGESYSKPDMYLTYYGVGGAFDFKGQLSARVGATYELVHGLNAYLSYSESFLPQENETYNNGVIGILPPLVGQQYEAGFKYLTNGGRLLLTAAPYKVHEKNIQAYQVSINGIDYYSPIGQDSHKGFEVAALGKLGTAWQINAGYSYLQPKIISASSSEQALVGQTEVYVPEQTASAFLTYQLLSGVARGLTLGAGFHYQSSVLESYRSELAREQSAGTPGVAVPPLKDIGGYVVADASASYTFDKWFVQLNGRNLFSKRYFINLYQTTFYGNETGPSAGFSLTIQRQF